MYEERIKQWREKEREGMRKKEKETMKLMKGDNENNKINILLISCCYGLFQSLKS